MTDRTGATDRNLRSQLDSVQVWKTFASAFPLELPPSSKCKRHVIERPNMRLGDYIKPASSSSLDWITFLTLSNISCARIDLIKISQLPNVGVLAIGPEVLAEDHGLDDGLIRTWARAAVTADAFSVLRVFCCRSQKNITPRVFSYITQFPALTILNVEDCDLNHQHKSDALGYGWKYRAGEVLRDCLVRSCTGGTDWDSGTHASFQLGGSSCREVLTAEAVNAIDQLPRLHLSIGGSLRAAAVGVIEKASMQSFYRTWLITSQEHNLLGSSLDERPSRHSQCLSSSKILRKLTVRSSKEQSLEAILLGTGGQEALLR